MSADARYLPEPRKRSIFARLLAVAVLAGVVVVLVMVVNKSLSIDDGEKSSTGTEQTASQGGNEIPKEYTVEDGDSLSSIAEEYGISTKRLLRINPDLDPNTLATGQVIKLH